MFDVVAACVLAFATVGFWVCLISVIGDKLGLGLSRWKAAILAPLFLVLSFVCTAHFLKHDLAARQSVAS
jgi:hypothetical protein